MNNERYKIQPIALAVVMVLGLALLIFSVSVGGRTSYRSGDYFVYTIFRDEVYMVANVKNDNELRAKLIRYEDAFENGLISDSSSIFRRFNIDGERIIQFVFYDN